ncbi:MAG: hypothetical protein HOH43_25735 [Candidatus Latescibacteria bacterium]|nr:hypothetical protein [Candidatus Latescibacterota bacterium]
MFEYKEGNLQIFGRDARALTRSILTPFFLIDEQRFIDNYTTLSHALGSDDGSSIVRYCIKTNNELGVLKVVAGLGSHAMASCPSEIQLASMSGITPERMSYQSPLLRERELHDVLDAGVKHVHAFRMEDLILLEEIAGLRGTHFQVSLRVQFESPGSPLTPLGFLSGRLGFSASEVVAAGVLCNGSSRLSLRGINFYLGTQRISPENYRKPISQVVSMATRLRHEHNIHVHEINVGGGVPSPSMRRLHLRPRDLIKRWRDSDAVSFSPAILDSFAKELKSVFHEVVHKQGFDPAPTLAVEAGRSLIGNATVLITRVCRAKGAWLFLDASRNDLGESPLLFRRTIMPAVHHQGAQDRFYHLSGRTLNTRDIIDLRRRLPEVREGDVLAIGDAGAYTIARSSRYAGLAPAVHMITTANEIKEIRRPETVEDLAGPMDKTHV